MKKLLMLLLFSACFLHCFSQDNPYAIFGYKPTVEYKDSKEDIYRVKNTDPTSNIRSMEFDFQKHSVKLLDRKDSVIENISIKDDQVLRFLSVDPFAAKYPELTPYQFASNTPIQAVDLDGLERYYYAISYNKNDRAYLTPTRQEDIIDYSIKLSNFPNILVKAVNQRKEFVVQGTTTRTWDNFGNTTFYQDEDQKTFSTLQEAKNHVAKNNGLGYVYSFSHQLGQSARVLAEEEVGGTGVLNNFEPSPSLNEGIVTKPDQAVTIEIKMKEGWTPEQQAAVKAKIDLINKSNPEVAEKTIKRASNTRSEFVKTGGQVTISEDVDHILDLQLGGSNSIENLQTLDKSVNRSLGSQIQNQIKDLKPGTKVNITIKAP